jgi:hypothetical protein
MIAINIDVKKIDKAALFTGKKGTYLNMTLMENREGVDQYGNEGFIVQDIGMARRQAGERGAILGNWKTVKPAQAPQALVQPQAQAKVQVQADDEDDESFIPF